MILLVIVGALIFSVFVSLTGLPGAVATLQAAGVDFNVSLVLGGQIRGEAGPPGPPRHPAPRPTLPHAGRLQVAAIALVQRHAPKRHGLAAAIHCRNGFSGA